MSESLTPQQNELLKQIESDISYHYRRSKSLKGRAYFFKLSVMLLGALVTVILGFEFSDETIWKTYSQNIALVLGALITLLTAIGNFWNTEKYWLNNTLTMMKLITLKNLMHFESKAEGGISEPKYTAIINEFNDIQKSKIDYWEDALTAG